MTCRSHDDGDVVVIEMGGEFWGGKETDALRRMFEDILRAGKKKVVVDLGGADSINSTGIGVLTKGLTSVTRAGGHMVLARVGKRIHNTLVITRLVFAFDTFDSVEDAVTTLREQG